VVFYWDAPGGTSRSPPPRGRPPPWEDGQIFGFIDEGTILPGGCPRGGGGAPRNNNKF